MRIQLSEFIYDHLVKCKPEYIISYRGLRNVLVSITAKLLGAILSKATSENRL